MKYLGLLLLTLIFQTVFGQTSCRISEIQIPKNQIWFMIGEIHLDNIRQQKSQEELQYVNKVLTVEDTLRRLLVDSFGVNHFVMESAVSLEYFFNKYVQTGDSMWINLFNNNEYQQGKLKSIAKINQQCSTLKVSCIDYNLKKYYTNFIQSLFCLTFYEPFATEFDSIAILQGKQLAYDNAALAQKLLANKNAFPEQLRPFFQLIIDWYQHHPETVAAEVYKVLISMNQNDEIWSVIEKFYGSNFPYYYRLQQAYVDGYYGEPETGRGLFEREQVMFWQLEALSILYPNDQFCLQMGAAHVLPNEGFDVVRQKIEKTFEAQPFCFYIIPQNKINFFSGYFATLNKINTQSICWQQFSIREAGIIIR